MNTTRLATARTVSLRGLKKFLPVLPPRAQRWAAILVLGLVLPLQVSGQALTDSTNFPVNLTVPDGSPDGLASTATVSTPIHVLTNLQVTLTITNGWNGDLYAYLVHDSGFVVLLNRPGKSDASPFGYSDSGFNNVTFDDGATTNVHTYRLALFGNENTPLGGPLTSTWAPDGRNVDPATVSSTNTPDTSLSSFNALNPNGQWTLFIADLSGGGISTLVNWGLEMKGTPGGPDITITAQPTNTTAECGGDATLSVTATGTGLLHYQWLFGSAPVGIDSSNLVLNSVSAANGGSYAVVITNSSGSITSQVATLTVQDTTPPSITMLGANPLTNECHAAFVDPGATATDSCTTPTLTTNSTVNPNAVGSYTITYVAIDGSGNSATNTRLVYVVDTTAPVPDMSSLSDVTGQCAASVTAPTAHDACDGLITATTGDPLTYTTQGTFTVHWTYTDSHGNVANQNQTVRVQDTVPPVITQCAPAQTVTAGYDGMTTLSNLTALVVASDACSATVHITQQPPAGTEISVGATTVVFYVDDGNGNTNTCSSTVTVNAAPLVPPTILSEQVLGDGSFQLTFSGPNGQPYKVLASTDVSAPLTDWTELTSGTFGADPATFIDLDGNPARFYQVVSP